MRVMAVVLLICMALCSSVAAENLATEMEALPKGVGVSFDLTGVPEKGATIAFRYYLAPRVV